LSPHPTAAQSMLNFQLGRRAYLASKVIGPRAALRTARYLDQRRASKAISDASASSPPIVRGLELLGGYANRHRGETCVIIGNGPSLAKTDISLLQDVPTFGLNRIYLAFQEWGFGTTYHVSINKFVAEQSGHEMAGLDAPLFTTFDNVDTFSAFDRETIYLWNRRNPGFYADCCDGVWEGATVTFVAMQLAFFMGFSRAVLVGVDHRFKSSGPAHELVQSTTEDVDHFNPSYFGPGYRWQLPDLETSEVAYTLAREAYTRDGREIIDSTVDGALTVFPKMTLAEALARTA
jgi:hypothetical protein